VQPNTPYRLWIHLRTSSRQSASGSLVFAQFSDAVDRNAKEIFALNSRDFLSIRGPKKEGWAWVGRDLSNSQSTEPILQFRTGGEINVRITAGSVGAWDELVLSPARYLERPPAEGVLPKAGK
jgi:hypothetical protein